MDEWLLTRMMLNKALEGRGGVLIKPFFPEAYLQYPGTGTASRRREVASCGFACSTNQLDLHSVEAVGSLVLSSSAVCGDRAGRSPPVLSCDGGEG